MFNYLLNYTAMKHGILTLLFLVLIFLTASGILLFAEVPQGISYQAVARNAQGNLVMNDNIQIRFTIRNGSANGNTVYQETHSIQTNEYGMFSLLIGKGSVNSGVFATIDWSVGAKFLQVEFKASSEVSFVDMGTQQLMSTPYSLNAQTANGLSSAARVSPDNIESKGASTGQVLKWDGSHWTPGTDIQASGGATYSAGNGIEISGSNVITNTGDLSATNELQNLSLNGNQLSISNGNSVTLPAGTNYSAGTGINITNGVISATAQDVSGDVTGNTGATTVTKIQGKGIATVAPSNEQVLQWNGVNWAPSSLTLNGDVSGSLSANTVTKLQGKSVANTAPANAQVLQWNGTAWAPTTQNLGGDVTGSLAASTVAKLQGRSVANTAPSNGQVLQWNGTAWTPTTPSAAAGGIQLPIDTTISTNNSIIKLTNSSTTSTGDVIRLTNNGLGRGVYAQISNTSNIVAAVRGETNGGGYGVQALATGNGNAGFFQISNAASTSSTMNVTTNGIGSGITIQLTNASNGARGLDVLQSGVGPGVFATSAGGNAVWGITSSISAAGVIGDNTFGEAVVGRNRGGNGVGAIVGRNDSSGYGVRGFNTKDGIGVLGQAGISGGTGVAGRFENVNAANTNDACQVATNGDANGLKVTSARSSVSNTKAAILATATDGTSISGITNGTSTSDAGIRGTASNSNAYAGYFSGKVHVAGTLSKTAGTFKIDHPQDPANKYLVHSFVESPDMMNIYNGNIVTDANGKSIVTLPSYFEAENISFKYQLTVIGQFAQAIVSKEVANNQFEIMTDKPNVKVSWQVTGVRNDVFAQQNRYVDVVEKEEENKGYYVYPQGYGMPLSKGIYSKGIEEVLKEMEVKPATPAPTVTTASESPVMVQPSAQK